MFREQRGGNLLTGYAASGIQGGVTLIRAFVRNLRAWLAMIREKAQVEDEAESTNAPTRVALLNSSGEAE